MEEIQVNFHKSMDLIISCIIIIINNNNNNNNNNKMLDLCRNEAFREQLNIKEADNL